MRSLEVCAVPWSQCLEAVVIYCVCLCVCVCIHMQVCIMFFSGMLRPQWLGIILHTCDGSFAKEAVLVVHQMLIDASSR